MVLPAMSTMGVGRGIVFPNDSVWRLQPPATNPRGIVELWNGNSGSSTPPTIMRTGTYAAAADGTVWEYAPPNLTQISSVFTPTTWNPSDSSNLTFSNGNLTVTGIAAGGARAIASKNNGKYYWENTYVALNTNSLTCGISLSSGSLTSPGAGIGLVQRASGNLAISGTSPGMSIGTIPASSIVGIAVDLVAQLIWFRISPSGNWNGNSSANPATGTGGASYSIMSGTLYPFVGIGGGDVMTTNFGASTFSGVVPTGFTAGWG